MGHEPTRLGSFLDQVITSLGLGEKYRGWRIVSRWPEIVGPEIAKHARAVRFADGVLIVVVEKDVWRQELEMQRERLLVKVLSQPGGGAVTRIVLKAGTSVENSDG